MNAVEKKQISPDHADENGATLLLAAVRKLNWELAGRLLDEGANPFIESKFGQCAGGLIIAAGSSELADSVRSWERLGGLKQEEPWPECQGLTLAAALGDADRIRLLLQEGIPADARDAWGYTALLTAIMNGQAEAADILFRAGADPNAQQSLAGFSIIRFMLQFKRHPIFASELMQKIAAAFCKVPSGNFYDLNCDRLITKPLLDSVASIHHLTAKNNKPRIEKLLQLGVSPMLHDSHGQTAVEIAYRMHGSDLGNWLSGQSSNASNGSIPIKSESESESDAKPVIPEKSVLNCINPIKAIQEDNPAELQLYLALKEPSISVDEADALLIQASRSSRSCLTTLIVNAIWKNDNKSFLSAVQRQAKSLHFSLLNLDWNENPSRITVFSGVRDLPSIIGNCDADALLRILRKHPSLLESRIIHELTPLGIALRYGLPSICEILLDIGANPWKMGSILGPTGTALDIKCINQEAKMLVCRRMQQMLSTAQRLLNAADREVLLPESWKVAIAWLTSGRRLPDPSSFAATYPKPSRQSIQPPSEAGSKLPPSATIGSQSTAADNRPLSSSASLESHSAGADSAESNESATGSASSIASKEAFTSDPIPKSAPALILDDGGVLNEGEDAGSDSLPPQNPEEYVDLEPEDAPLNALSPEETEAILHEDAKPTATQTNMNSQYIDLPPSAPILSESLRGLGYSLGAAVADIIDNSIAAHAEHIWIDYSENPSNGWLSIRDDGCGMTEDELIQAMRFGSSSPKRSRRKTDLGRFGLGLKTASFSQCRRLIVCSKKNGALSAFLWDLDDLASKDAWEIERVAEPEKDSRFDALKAQEAGTVVLWEKIDRSFASKASLPQEQRKVRLKALERLEKHLRLTFHRFLEADPMTLKPDVQILFGPSLRPVKPWDPFFTSSFSSPANYAEEQWTDDPVSTGKVIIQPYVVPIPNPANPDDFLYGPDDLLDLQGFFIYRNKRLICCAGWMHLGIRRDPLYGLARIKLEFNSEDDLDWQLDIRKSTITIPRKPKWSELIKLLRLRADAAAQKSAQALNGQSPAGSLQTQTPAPASLWKKIRGEGTCVDFASPLGEAATQALVNAKEPGVVKGILEILALAHPSQQDKAPFAQLSSTARVGLAELVAAMAVLQQESPAQAVDELRTTPPFSTWGDVLDEIEGSN